MVRRNISIPETLEEDIKKLKENEGEYFTLNISKVCSVAIRKAIDEANRKRELKNVKT